MHVEPDFGLVLQTSQAAEVGRVARDGETPNYASCYADTGSGIAKFEKTEPPALIGLTGAKPERDFISLVVESAAALQTIPHSRECCRCYFHLRRVLIEKWLGCSLTARNPESQC